MIISYCILDRNGIGSHRERIRHRRQRISNHLQSVRHPERRIVGPQAESIVLEAQSVVTELHPLIRRELHPLRQGIFDGFQALCLTAHLGSGGLQNLGVLVRLAEVVLDRGVVVLDSVSVLLENGCIEVRSVRCLARTGVLTDPLVRHEHVHIDVGQGRGGDHARTAPAADEHQRKQNQRQKLLHLPQLCTEILLESLQDSFHGPFHILVREGLLQILEHETESVLLLSAGNLVPAVDVEQSHALEKLAGLLECGHTKIGKRHGLVQKECQIAAHLGELGKSK